MELKNYRVTTDAWINGDFYAANSTIVMKPTEAKYWLLAGTIEEIKIAPAFDVGASASSSKASRSKFEKD